MNVNRIPDSPALAAATADTLSPARPAAADAASPAGTSPPQSLDELRAAIASANRHLTPASQRLEMSWDTESRRVLVKLVDLNTREVIRQIPSEDALALARRLASLGERFDAHA